MFYDKNEKKSFPALFRAWRDTRNELHLIYNKTKAAQYECLSQCLWNGTECLKETTAIHPAACTHNGRTNKNANGDLAFNHAGKYIRCPFRERFDSNRSLKGHRMEHKRTRNTQRFDSNRCDKTDLGMTARALVTLSLVRDCLQRYCHQEYHERPQLQLQ